MDKHYRKIAAAAFIFVLLIIASMFWLAGRLDYWQGWAFGTGLLLSFVTKTVVFAGKSDLLNERLRPGPGVKVWDKIFLAVFSITVGAGIIWAVLDGGRFHWTGRLPVLVYIFAYTLLTLSVLLFSWAESENNWFSIAVRIQKDRAQKVVQSGPYKYVRHPGYTAGIIMLICIPLALGSLWAVIAFGIACILLLARTYLEDKTLKKELPGYSAYAGKVKYRLLPGIW
ncbi:MAG: isoprenylcysteine carboxylmethyltransferase family protein [Candidatus Woesearchaeota archaeon]